MIHPPFRRLLLAWPLAWPLASALALVGCAGASDAASALDSGSPPPLSVPLWWIPSVGDSDWESARAGLWWALSNLGASPPAGEGGLILEAEPVEADDGVRFTLDLGAVGFADAALLPLADALQPVRVAAEREGSVDLGRFLLATLYDPSRYYAITGACPTLVGWRTARQSADPLLYAVTLSLLVEGDRRISLNPIAVNPVNRSVDALAYAAEEGEGSLAAGDFHPLETEVVDLFPTGQQRFAIYDEFGALRAASASGAGQPGKCIWCHETSLQRGTSANPGVPGYLTSAAFMEAIDAAEGVMEAARHAAPGAVRWDEPLVHEWAERLTLSFLEPSASRVAIEWGIG